MIYNIRDAWQNAMVGLGISGLDKSQGTTYAASCEVSAQALSAIYRGNWLARKLVEALPQRALARGFSDNTPMPPDFQRLNYARWDEGALQRACYLGRLFGGSHLFIGYANGGDDLSKPVTGKGRVAFLDIFTRHELTPASVGGVEARDADPASLTAGQVQIYEVTGDHPRRGMKYHISRAIQFGGLSLPPLMTPGFVPTTQIRAYDPYYRDWTDSVLKPAWDDIQRYGVWWQSVGHLMSVASVGVMKVGSLMQSLNQNDGAIMRARIDLANQMLALTRNLMLDADKNEDYDRKGVNFSDIPQLLDQMMIATAGAFNMPATELFGRAPQGMNATGESDHRMWEAQVTEWRERVLSPRVDALAEALSGTPTHIEFPEVHIATDAEQADLEFKRAQRDERFWSMGAFSDQEIRNAWQAGEQVEHFAKKPDVPPDPTRAVVQIQSETKAEGADAGGGFP